MKEEERKAEMEGKAETRMVRDDTRVPRWLSAVAGA
jgi:hypothetical protein